MVPLLRLEANKPCLRTYIGLAVAFTTFSTIEDLGERNVGMLGPRRVSRCMSMLGCLDERVVKLDEEVGSVLSNSL